MHTLALKGWEGKEVPNENGIVAFHNDTHADGQTPEDSHGICFDGLTRSEGLLDMGTILGSLA